MPVPRLGLRARRHNRYIPCEDRPDVSKRRAAKDFLQTLWDDLEIWRYQIYVEHPAPAQQDAKPYGALRKWARQFYDLEPTA